MSTRKLAWLAVPIALATTLAACGPGGSSTGGSASNPVTIGIGEPQHLIPSNTVESNGTQVVVALWTPLITYDSKGAPVMAAADSITSGDQKVWTINLKPGWTFANGEPVTSDSYINAWNYAAYGPNAQLGTDFFERIAGYADLQSANASTPPKASTLSGLRKLSDTSFQVTLNAPFSQFELLLGDNVFYPLPHAAFSSPGKINPNFEQSPVGQGPFKMNGVWNHNQNIAVQEYGNYKGTKPKVSNINFRIYQDQNTMYDDLIAGNLDVQPQIPMTKLANAPTDLGDRFRKTPSSYIGFITIPSYIPAYTLPIRQAVSMAFNRQEITQKIFQGAYRPATSWVSPIVQGYRPDTCGKYCDYDPAAAKALWTRTGGVPGNKILLYYNADGGHKDWVDAVCDQLKANLGVDCRGTPVAQFADLRNQARAHTLQGFLRGARAFDYPSIADYLAPLYATGAPSNDGAYSNPTFDAALLAAGAAPNQQAAVKGYQGAEDIIAKDLPVIPTWFRDNLYGYSTRMSNVNVDLFANVDVTTLAAR